MTLELGEAIGYVIGTLLDPLSWVISGIIAIVVGFRVADTNGTRLNALWVTVWISCSAFALISLSLGIFLQSLDVVSIFQRTCLWGSISSLASQAAFNYRKRSHAGKTSAKEFHPVLTEPDYIHEIRSLSCLKEQGLLTEEEFVEKKRALLGIFPSKQY